MESPIDKTIDQAQAPPPPILLISHMVLYVEYALSLSFCNGTLWIIHYQGGSAMGFYRICIITVVLQCDFIDYAFSLVLQWDLIEYAYR